MSKVAHGIRKALRDAKEWPLELASRNTFRFLLENLRAKKELFYLFPKRSPELIELTQIPLVEKFTHQSNLALIEQHPDEILMPDLAKALVVLEISILANIRKFIIEEHVGMTDDEFIDELARLSTAYPNADLQILCRRKMGGRT